MSFLPLIFCDSILILNPNVVLTKQQIIYGDSVLQAKGQEMIQEETAYISFIVREVINSTKSLSSPGQLLVLKEQIAACAYKFAYLQRVSDRLHTPLGEELEKLRELFFDFSKSFVEIVSSAT